MTKLLLILLTALAFAGCSGQGASALPATGRDLAPYVRAEAQ